ncbi:MAG: DUF2256 domain-containing protein [Rhizobiaceae bacterium]|nr:DUF2256 domain-containing protein [Rhizobiaceae bacterium]
MRRKQHLPVKTCPVCNKDFTWRRKWKKNWSEVLYCSGKCRGNKRSRSCGRDDAILKDGFSRI